MKNFFVLLISLMFLFSLVSANVLVNFNVLNGTIDNNQRINGTSPVSNFDVEGYSCGNSACTLIGTKVASLSGHSNSNSIQLSFPTNLVSTNGYILYFYKDGYIGYEVYGIKVFGTEVNPVNYPANIYLSKKKFGVAEIKDLTGNKSDIFNGTVLTLNYNVFADGSSYDAVLDQRHSNVPLQENVKVDSWFLIKDSNNNLVYQKKESNNLEYSGNFAKSFNYQFNHSGIYNVTILSEITDAKILNKINSTFSFRTNVSSSQITNPPVLDTTKPVLTVFDYSGYINQSVSLQLSATDNVGISFWKINDTSKFSINQSGYLKNITSLEIGTYYLNISVNDTSNNLASGISKIEIKNLSQSNTPVLDLIKPVLTLYNYSGYINQSVSLQLSATDNVGISFWKINDTSKFSINQSGFITNITALAIGTYYLNISVNDTSNNIESGIIKIIINDLNSSNNSSNNSSDSEESDNACHNCKKKSKNIIYLSDTVKKMPNQINEEEVLNNTISLSFKKSTSKINAELIYNWILFILVLSMLLILLMILVVSKKHL